MSSRFQNIYRIASARLQTWNYANPGMYFITICTKEREFYFGEIIDEQMHLSELGKIAETEWIKTVELRPDMNLELGEFVIMPNHMHGIILIGKNQYNTGGGKNDGHDRRDAMHCVSTTTNEKPNDSNNENKSVNQFGPQSKNLGSILRGYKSAVTTFARKNNIQFDWQARYHDHIIRSIEEYYRISNYIINNPANWRDDRFYK
jgi:REP element-mobilizing transposase RayT